MATSTKWTAGKKKVARKGVKKVTKKAGKKVSKKLGGKIWASKKRNTTTHSISR